MKSWKLTRKFRIPEKKLDSLSNNQQGMDLGTLEVPFEHMTVTFIVFSGLNMMVPILNKELGYGWCQNQYRKDTEHI